MRFNTPALLASAVVALSFVSFTEAKSHHKCGTMGTQRCQKKEVHAPWKWFTKFNKPDHHYVQECGYDGKWQTQHWCEEDSVADYCAEATRKTCPNLLKPPAKPIPGCGSLKIAECKSKRDRNPGMFVDYAEMDWSYGH